MSLDLASLFDTVSKRTGLSTEFMTKTSWIESRWKTDAVNDSGATGLFQFLKGTAADYNLVDRLDATASTNAFVKFTSDNVAYLTNALGRAPSDREKYLAHQQGMGGATKLLQNPFAKAIDLVGKNAVVLNGGNVNMSANEFAEMVMGKYDNAPGTIGGEAGNESGGIWDTVSSWLPFGDNGVLETFGEGINTGFKSFTEGLTDLFAKGIVIGLGFIFVAVGLSMFRGPAIVQELTKAVK